MANRLPTSPAPLNLSAKARRTHDSPISSLMAVSLANPELISFAAGFVDPLTLPLNETLAITGRILADPMRGRGALQYDTTVGLKPLREALVTHLESLENHSAASLGYTADDLLITTGSQQALYLIADSLLDPGDIVIAANPSYFVFTATLQSLATRVLPVPMDDDGMDVEAVGTLLARLEESGDLPSVKFIYCTSFFDNPTGLSLSAPRRKRLVEIVKQFSKEHRILILEDAAYRELRYDGPSLPSIKSFDPDNQYTILTQTFSKPFAPGLKLGYTVMPHSLLDPILHQKSNHDFGSSSLCQHIALEALRDGSYHSHLETLRREYRRKRDAMLAALKRYLPDLGHHWTDPHGGLYVWLTLAASIDSRRSGPLFKSCLDRGVLYVPGDYCFQPDESGQIPSNHMRLSFGNVAIEQIDPGIGRLAEAIHSLLPVARRSLSTGATA